MPVFRYALERWPASPYELVLFHRGQLSERHQALITRLTGQTSSNNAPVNITVQTVDLAANPPSKFVELWQRHKSAILPTMVLCYPPSTPAKGEVWSGPLSEETVQGIMDSPLRRRVVQRLLRGDSAVWVLLESGDQSQDAAAARLLQERLEHLQNTLKLPRLEAEDVDNRVISIPESELKVVFSVLGLARTNLAEQIFVRMLLGSEEDLTESTEPIAFPIFGRGCVLYALVGKGINHETIDEACSFLVGPCSCVVKEENPGMDLLLSADWDRLVHIQSTPNRDLPELTGFTASATEQALAKSNAIVATTSVPVPAKDQAGPRRTNLLRTGLITGMATLVILSSLIVWRRVKP